MNKIQLRQYVSLIKTEWPNLTEEMIEKDYYLSLFLTRMYSSKQTEFKNLIFKGGTLLSKLYLNYHRISEDLDFTYIRSNYIRTLLTNKQIDKKIKVIQHKLIEEIKNISNPPFIFYSEKHPSLNYISMRNKRIICFFYVYFESLYSIDKISQIKVEINFIENQIKSPVNKKLLNLVDLYKNKLLLKSLNFDIETVNLLVYNLDEIILEKYRAILTRKQIKERDLFDLYLINKTKDVFKVKNNEILNKVSSSFKFLPKTKDFYNVNLKNIKNNEIEITQDISNLSIIKYETQDFINFKNKVFKKLNTLEFI